MSDTRIKTIIRGLLAKAASTDSEEEASAFLAKVEQLMEKHQIDLHELGEADPIGMTPGITAQPGPPAYKSEVLCALAKFYGARPIRNFNLEGLKRGHWRVELCGPESARATTELMFEYVWNQVMAQAKVLRVERHMDTGVAIRHIVKALCLRLSTLTSARKAKPAESGTSFSLVVVNATEQFMKQQYPDMHSTKLRPRSIHGRAEELAKGIHVSEQIGAQPTLALC